MKFEDQITLSMSMDNIALVVHSHVNMCLNLLTKMSLYAIRDVKFSKTENECLSQWM